MYVHNNGGGGEVRNKEKGSYQSIVFGGQSSVNMQEMVPTVKFRG